LAEATFSLQAGDLLFQDSDCGPFCEAIEKVTTGYQGARLSHVGIVVEQKGTLVVIEAISAGVVLTSIDSFLHRSLDENGNPKVLVGRLKEEFQPLVKEASQHAMTKLGKSYDDIFDIQNDAYYCSELVYESFLVANQGVDVFYLYPMTFKDPDSKETFGIWDSYFKKLNFTIPEGELGLNPGGISRSEKIKIVHAYGNIVGMEK